MDQTRPCPDCGETADPDVLWCPHCGTTLHDPSPADVADEPGSSTADWYDDHRWYVVGAALESLSLADPSRALDWIGETAATRRWLCVCVGTVAWVLFGLWAPAFFGLPLALGGATVLTAYLLWRGTPATVLSHGTYGIAAGIGLLQAVAAIPIPSLLTGNPIDLSPGAFNPLAVAVSLVAVGQWANAGPGRS